MGKSVHDDVLDAAHNKSATCITITVCSAEPANYAAISGLVLASGTLVAGVGNGDYVIANGDVSGRKLTIAQQANLSITANGDATHIARDDGTTLLRVTTCATQTLTSGGTVTISAHDEEIEDPA
ncbi:hypothetical protein [Teredinibacter purpureus]|uniref:hypothetical protein n=1 Tax=Teredinibacter purpureus TaxID=2731756 RepID=UPI0005F83EE5|nr:hypothetical protein [Teredinibacter purpureus]